MDRIIQVLTLIERKNFEIGEKKFFRANERGQKGGYPGVFAQPMDWTSK
jgi:hypothetical protein